MATASVLKPRQQHLASDSSHGSSSTSSLPKNVIGCGYPYIQNSAENEEKFISNDEMKQMVKTMVGGPVFFNHQGYDRNLIRNMGEASVPISSSENAIGRIHKAWIDARDKKLWVWIVLNDTPLAMAVSRQQAAGSSWMARLRSSPSAMIPPCKRTKKAP
eukprot:GEZU01033715.1.p1 GENE.GEZU01033715.1~~GEZU01033715.1.p1  ORF type:complete len:160 (-),score=30.04 GEZU01033715.1:164-643(-)